MYKAAWCSGSTLGSQPRCNGFESQVGFVFFLSIVTLSHLTVNRYGRKPRVCDLAISAGVEGWESYPILCMCRVLSLRSAMVEVTLKGKRGVV